MRRLSIFLVSIVFLWNINTQSAVLEKMSIQDMTRDANLIIQGKVQKIYSEWNNAHDKIYTYVEVTIDSFLKNSVEGGIVTIRLLGGKIDDITTYAIGAPQFYLSEEVILFLKSVQNDTSYRVVGFSQGKFTVTSKVDESGKMVRRNLKGNSFTLSDTILPPDSMNLNDLLQTVADEINK